MSEYPVLGAPEGEQSFSAKIFEDAQQVNIHRPSADGQNTARTSAGRKANKYRTDTEQILAKAEIGNSRAKGWSCSSLHQGNSKISPREKSGKSEIRSICE
jgi:hypothetical protein